MHILLAGGPGAAHEAEEFAWSDHTVIPVKCTGGAAGGKFKVPEKIFEVCIIKTFVAYLNCIDGRYVCDPLPQNLEVKSPECSMRSSQ